MDTYPGTDNGRLWSDGQGRSSLDGLPERALVALVQGLLLVLCAAQVAGFWLSQPSSLVTQFSDDAYFYFEIARNVVELGRSTFDGSTLTNGFHPLWMGLLIPVFALCKDPVLALRAAGTLNVILLAAGCLLGLRYLSRRFSLLPFGISAVVGIKYFLAFAQYGMETSLLILLCVVALAAAESIDSRSPLSGGAGRLTLLGIVMALLQLARLDAVLLNVILAAVLIVPMLTGGGRAAAGRAAALFVGPSLLSGAAYLAFSRVVYGHLLPVSAAAKSMGSDAVNVRMLRQFIPSASPAAVTSIWTVFAAMIIVSLVYLAVLAGRVRRSREPRSTGNAGLAAAVFAVAFVGYYLFRSSWMLWGWYAYPGFLAAMFVLPEVVRRLEGALPTTLASGWAYRAARVVAVAVAVVLVVVTARSARWGSWRDADVEADFTYQNYRLAEALNVGLPEHPMIAMGDRAGSFGYFYRGTVLQMEGLVGDYSLLDAIAGDSLAGYMSASGVQYVVCYNGPAPGYGTWTLRVPSPEFSAGPYARVRLCESTQVVREETWAGAITVWKWPSCGVSANR